MVRTVEVLGSGVEQDPNVCVDEGVEDPASLAACLDDLVRAQRPQRVGNGRLGDP